MALHWKGAPCVLWQPAASLDEPKRASVEVSSQARGPTFAVAVLDLQGLARDLELDLLAVALACHPPAPGQLGASPPELWAGEPACLCRSCQMPGWSPPACRAAARASSQAPLRAARRSGLQGQLPAAGAARPSSPAQSMPELIVPLCAQPGWRSQGHTCGRTGFQPRMPADSDGGIA